MHQVVQPKILYFGTPVVLISTLNEDGTPNLAPISSAWWLGQSCMIGMSSRSKTVQNLERTRECVLNLATADLVSAVDRLALLTGSNPMPGYKAKMGYRYEPDKFGAAGLTPVASTIVEAPRVLECPVQLEALVEQMHPFGETDSHLMGIELSIVRVYAEDYLLNPDHRNHIDPEQWNPLIMNFCEFFGLSGKLQHSRLADAFAPFTSS